MLNEQEMTLELIEAVRVKDLERIKNAIKKGANISYGNDYALRNCCDKNDLEIIKILVKNNANIYAANNDLFRHHVSCGNLEIVEYLLENAKDIDPLNGNSLRNACYKGDLEIVKCLLNKNSNIHIDDIDGNQPLIESARYDYVLIVELLYERYEDKNKAQNIITTNGTENIKKWLKSKLLLDKLEVNLDNKLISKKNKI